MTEQTERAEVEALSEALSSPGFVNAITDAVDGAFRNPPPPSTLHDDAHPIAIADAAVGAARDYLLASDWLAADRAAAEARGAERVREDAESALTEEIANRDAAEDWADRLAYAIAPQSVIGEHSSGNNPWLNALDELAAHDARVLQEAADAVQDECRSSSSPCFCASADYLRDRAARAAATGGGS